MAKEKGPAVITLAKGHWDYKKGRMTSKAKVKDREAEVKRILKKLGLDRKNDLLIMLDPNIKHGQHSSNIAINPNLPDDKFYQTLAHELLHYIGLPHNEDALKIMFNSKNWDKDLLSKTLAQLFMNEVD